MEIFQTIWTALTNESKLIIDILGIVFTPIEAFITMLLFTSILNIQTNKKKKIIYIIIMSISSTLIRYLLPNPYGTYINILVMIISIIVIFKVNVFKSFLCILIPFTIIILIETIFSKIYSSLLHIDYAQGMLIPIHRFIGLIIIYSLELSIYFIFKYLKLNFYRYEILDRRKKILFALNIIFSIILICIQLYIITLYSSILPFFVLILSVFSAFIYCIISLYTIFTTSELENTTINLEEAQLYNKTLEILQDNTRAFRHDFTNILLGMTGYMDRNDMEGLKKYHSQLLDDIKQVNNLTTLSPTLVNNPAVYNVLASKYHKADSLGIKINLEVFLDLNDLHMKIYEFTRILGILMDNAIEATSECEDKIINVSIRKNTKKHMQLLQIDNTYKDKEINTDKIFEKGYSTKKGNTGLGLWEIRQILKKNNNLNLYTSKNETYFSQQLEIYY